MNRCMDRHRLPDYGIGWVQRGQPERHSIHSGFERNKDRKARANGKRTYPSDRSSHG